MRKKKTTPRQNVPRKYFHFKNQVRMYRLILSCLLSLVISCENDNQNHTDTNLFTSLLGISNSTFNILNLSSKDKNEQLQFSENEQIKILAHNVYMLPNLISNWGQTERAQRIASSDYIKNQDLIVFEETFDTNARKILLDGIRSQYPFQTDVIGRTKDGWDSTLGNYRSASITNGGVVIVSKWPIEEKVQYVFNNAGCGADWFSNKGFAYVRINKNGKKIHLIGTHVQAADSACSDLGRSVRTEQFTDIKNFIASKGIPNTETVLIAGDLNVVKGTSEYYDMISILNVNEPKYSGVPFTWDTKTNETTAYSNEDAAPEYLDYILVSKTNSQPQVWQNLAYDPISTKTWNVSGYTSDEFSDHYPVYGFIYADANTPTRSGHKRKYDQVSFVSTATGKRIQADSSQADGWLKANTTVETMETKFNLVQENNPDSNPSCIQSGTIRIEPSHRLNYFWNWWLGGGGGNYAYYPKFNDGSNRLEIVNLDGGCIQDGSKIAFKDYDTFWRKYYYLTVWNGESWNESIYLWTNSAGPRETFYLRLDSSPVRDWSADLIYSPTPMILP
ncbi:sphingomyelin phosphodiesterase [Leptospira barantonii]|uniref:Sphingomyelin phosphodiesterase n=1 Tax=Leptospira barantonii TaxID=2023184 RepID=A0ABX4NQH4_9LEPT|nr:sphingomyelin phosphodiesterase [Leptospira barantonii]PJZ58897.1 sphingomyelin phosphodiesterase [Leptospira barantonii]